MNTIRRFIFRASRNEIDAQRFLRTSPAQQIHNKLQLKGTKYINQQQKVKKKQNKEHIVQCKKLIVAGGKESGREKKAPY
jgi:3-deoxy-D-manno-octulosonic-acid transferase